MKRPAIIVGVSTLLVILIALSVFTVASPRNAHAESNNCVTSYILLMPTAPGYATLTAIVKLNISREISNDNFPQLRFEWKNTTTGDSGGETDVAFSSSSDPSAITFTTSPFAVGSGSVTASFSTTIDVGVVPSIGDTCGTAASVTIDVP